MPMHITRAVSVGVSPGHQPSAGLLRNGRLCLNLGSDHVEIALTDPRANLEAIRDAIQAVLSESETSHG